MAAALTKSMILEEQSRPQNLEPCALTTLVTLITTIDSFYVIMNLNCFYPKP